MNPLFGVAAFVGGVALLVWTVLQRRGRQAWARQWAQNEASDMSLQMLGIPGIGLIMTGVPVAYFGVGTPVEDLALVLGGPTFLAGFVMGLWGMFTFEPPLWFLPKWSREPLRERREAEQTRRRKRWRRRWEKWTGRSTTQRRKKSS